MRGKWLEKESGLPEAPDLRLHRDLTPSTLASENLLALTKPPVSVTNMS